MGFINIPLSGDLLSVSTFSALPTSGILGQAIVTLDTSRIYIWNGSTWVNSAGTTSALFASGYQAFTPSSPGTTTLLTSSPQWIVFKGTGAQTVNLPPVATLQIGVMYGIQNNQTDASNISVQDSAGNGLTTLYGMSAAAAGNLGLFVVRANTGTGTTIWAPNVFSQNDGTGKLWAEAINDVGLTASTLVASDASKNLVSLTGPGTSGSYTSANITVDAYGRITAAANGTPSYGHMYGANISQHVVVSVEGAYYQVGAGLSGGLTNGFTFQNARELECLVAGTYLLNWSMSVDQTSGSNQEIEGTYMINGVQNLNGSAHGTSGAATHPDVIAGNAIVTLAINDLVSLGVSNQTSTDDIVVEHATLTVTQLV